MIFKFKFSLKNLNISSTASTSLATKVNILFCREITSLGAITLGCNQNVGLGQAFHDFEGYLEMLGEPGYVYFDQDTKTTDSVWKAVVNNFEIFETRRDAGMLFFGNKKERFSNVVINSGCLFSTDVISRVGKHCPSYFVEGVDYDYCLRLNAVGLKIYNIYCPDIDHHSLQDGKDTKILDMSFSYRIYGSRRLKDFNSSHFKLIKKSLINGQGRFFLFFIKSLILFNIVEHASRLLQRIKSCS